MFERLSADAARTLVAAQAEARLLGHEYLGTEHLALGLVAEQDSAAARVLISCGVDVDALRRLIRDLGGAAAPSSLDSWAFTSRAGQVMELALREARRAGQGSVGAEHLLLGLVAERKSIAAQVLQTVGVTLDLARHRVQTLPLSPGGPTPLGAGGPRCPNCRDDLVPVYRQLRAEPETRDAVRRGLTITVVYCRRCGAVMGLLAPPK